MANKRLNIEIGERLTKVCLAKQQGKGVQAIENFTFNTPEGCVTDGEIVNANELAEVLKAQLENKEIKGTSEMVLVIDSSKFASREVLLPPMKKKLLDTAIQENASTYFPVNLSDYKVSYTLLEEVKGEKPGLKVQVTIAPNTLLSTCVKFADAAGIRLVGIDSIGNSQLQVLQKLPMTGTTMSVNVGVGRTLVTFIKDNKLVLQRNIPVGGEILMREIANADVNEGEDFYKVLKRAEDKSWLDHNKLAMNPNDVTRFMSSITRSLEYYKSSNQGEDIDQVVVFGSGSGIVGVKEAVAKATEATTMFLSEVEGVEKIVGTDFPDLYAPTLGSTIFCLDLLSPEMLRRIKVTSSNESVINSIKLGLLVLVVGSAVGGISAAFSIMAYNEAVDELAATEARIEELSYVEEVYTTSLAYDAMRSNLEVLESYGSDNNNANLTAFIDELEQKMPSNLIALTADCTNYSVSMSVEVESMDEAAVVISELRTFESLGQIQVSTIEETVDDLGMPVTKFTLMCAYPTEETVVVPVQPEETQWETTTE